MIHATTVHETLTRLTRLAQRRPECGRWLTESLWGRPELAQTALDVAVESGDPIGRRLASLLASGDDPEHIEAVAELYHASYQSSPEGGVSAFLVSVSVTFTSVVRSGSPVCLDYRGG